MSGQPLRVPSDAERFRKAYLASLDVQIANNEKNLQANLLHKRTGQLTTQITDYRTTSEKLADATMLKIDVRRQLRRICDVHNTEQIVSQLSDDDVRFVAQHIEQIVKELSPKNRYGVEAPKFMSYLRKLIKLETESTAGPIDIGDAVVEKIADISNELPDETEIEEVSKFVSENTADLDVKQQVTLILTLFGAIINFLPEISDKLLNNDEDPVTVDACQKEVDRILKDLMTKSMLRQELLQMETVKGDTSAVEELALKMIQKIGSEEELQEKIRSLEYVLSTLTPTFKLKLKRGKAGASETKGELESEEEEDTLPPLVLPTEKMTASAAKEIIDAYSYRFDAYEIPSEEEWKKGEGRRNSSKVAYYRAIYPLLEKMITDEEVKKRESKQLGGDSGGGGGGWAPAEVNYYGLAPKSRLPEGEGRGLKKKIKGKGLPVDFNKGVPKKVIFAPFGRFFINLVKLDQDILCFSRAKGTNIAELKTQRVSEDLAIVIRKIVNGATPTFNDLNALSANDKRYYADILSKCHISSGEGIDVPKVDNQDLNKFEIMKGEILSGNDSTQLIKEFKLMIIKLIHNGRLPKSEGKELLMDLAQLGY